MGTLKSLISNCDAETLRWEMRGVASATWLRPLAEISHGLKFKNTSNTKSEWPQQTFTGKTQMDKTPHQLVLFNESLFSPIMNPTEGVQMDFFKSDLEQSENSRKAQPNEEQTNAD